MVVIELSVRNGCGGDIMSKRKFIVVISLILLLALIPVSTFAGNETSDEESMVLPAAVPGVTAPSAILVEAETGQVLYSKDPDQPLHISAANKLMTVLVAIENSTLDAYVTASTESIGAEGFVLPLTAGSKYPLEELLYAIMLTSANDAALAVAEHVGGGDISKFVAKMNETARKLGMENTNFTNPTGLLEENQYTTAKDISILVRYAIKNPSFNRIFSAKVRPWYYENGEIKILTSSNNLFWSYEGILGGKTGFNDKERQSIVCTAVKQNMTLISVVLDTSEASMYTDTEALLDYGFNNYRKSTLVSKGDVLKTAEFEGKEINLISQSDFMYVHPLGENYIAELTVHVDLKPPLKKSQPVGSAVYVLKDGTTINVSLFPETEITPPEDFKTTIKKTVQENKDIFMLVAFLLAIEVLLLVFNLGRLVKKLVVRLIRH